MSLYAVAGYMTPHGFHAMDYIDVAEDGEYWFQCASLDLLSCEGKEILGHRVRVEDITPCITVDHTMDTWFLRQCGGRAQPEAGR